MRQDFRPLLFCAVAFLLFVPTIGAADDAPLRLMGGSASPVSPHHHPSIRMDAEEVTIRLHQDSYTVDAVFHFFNKGETERLSVGFPKRGLGDLNAFRGAEEFIRFETWVNGQEAQWSEEPDSSSIRGIGMNLKELIENIKANRTAGLLAEDSRWMVKKVSFPGQATTITRVRYEAPYSSSSAGSLAYYIYGTGAFWKDNIGMATFTIDGTEVEEILEVDFSDVKRSKIQVRKVAEKIKSYEIKDFKPGSGARLSLIVATPVAELSQQPSGPELTYADSKTVTGEVVASAPRDISLRAEGDTDNRFGEQGYLRLEVGAKTHFTPARRPAVGETVEVEYHYESGIRIAHKVRLISR